MIDCFCAWLVHQGAPKLGIGVEMCERRIASLYDLVCCLNVLCNSAADLSRR